MFTIECTKDPYSKLWCFDYIFTDVFQVQNEPLMEQATGLIDAILLSRYNKIPKYISITFDWLQLPEPDAVLALIGPDKGGSMYQATRVLDWTENTQQHVWLCSVLTYFFQEPPENLYIYINEEQSISKIEAAV